MNLQPDLLRKIIEPALKYPSGDNCQPWTFKASSDRLEIFHDSERAAHPLNRSQMASLISLGCLLEALSVSASEQGYETHIQLHDFRNTPSKSWASVRFTLLSSAKSSLFKALSLRSTDRRIFQGGELPASLLTLCRQTHREISQPQLHSLSSPPKELIDYLVQAESLMAEDPEILPSVAQWTRLTKAQAEKTRDGLTLENMGMRLWEVPALLLIQNFPVVLKLMKPAIASSHQARVRDQLNSSAGLVCLSIPRNSLPIIPEAGRKMFRAWLELTEAGFGVQPVSIPLFLIYWWAEQLPGRPLNSKWNKLAQEGEHQLRKSFSLPDHHVPIWMIRTGLSTPLPKPMRTYRKSIDEVLRFTEPAAISDKTLLGELNSL